MTNQTIPPCPHDGYDNPVRICDACAKAAVDSGYYAEDEDGILKQIERGEG